MSPVYRATTARAATAPGPQPTCDCVPACPECGGLSCVCRPRFFAGQLLSEVELNGVIDYVRDRNRQHNRMLGYGVVCGLDVSCDPCGGGSVTVSPGQALSPCGEEIDVCSPASVSICDLIEQCRRRDDDWNCVPYGAAQSNCAEREEKWILYIHYAETLSRPMTALRGSGARTSSGCGCGGASSASSSSGCGCGGSSATKSAGRGWRGSSATKSAGCGCGGSTGVGDRCAGPAPCTPVRQSAPTPAACEPTTVCETFSFSVARVEPDERKVADDKLGRSASATASAFAGCKADLDRALPKKPVGAHGADEPAWYDWCCAVRAALPPVLRTHALHDCSLLERLQAVICPAVDNPHFDELMTAAEDAYDAIVTDLLRSCLCSLLLPPCPAPVDDDRVALATITVRRDPCTVVSICNWDARRIVVTPAAMTYWLSLLRIPDLLRAVVERLCCEPVRRGREPGVSLEEGLPMVAAMASAMSANQASRAAMPRLVESLFAAEPKLTQAQAAQPTEYVLAHDVLAPLLRSTNASWVAGLHGRKVTEEDNA